MWSWPGAAHRRGTTVTMDGLPASRPRRCGAECGERLGTRSWIGHGRGGWCGGRWRSRPGTAAAGGARWAQWPDEGRSGRWRSLAASATNGGARRGTAFLGERRRPTVSRPGARRRPAALRLGGGRGQGQVRATTVNDQQRCARARVWVGSGARD
jgi:hypothetical protein